MGLREFALTAEDLAQVEVRSGMVRSLGHLFPRSDVPRIRIQIRMDQSRREWSRKHEQRRDSYVPSLADVRRLRKPRRKRHTIQAVCLGQEYDDEASSIASSRPSSRQSSRNSSPGSAPASAGKAPVDSAKLLALESELAKLRAMIAVVVTKQEVMASAPPPPLGAACGAPAAPPPPPMMAGGPPPPPPPPPSAASLIPKKQNISEIIRRNRKGQAGQMAADAAKKGPSMADVLKGLGTVKLKSIDRSPGGTPIRAPPTEQMLAGDPAAMIAMALKRKFAHRIKEEDEDDSWAEKENEMLKRKQAKAKASPPKFGIHMLKKSKRKPLGLTQPEPENIQA